MTPFLAAFVVFCLVMAGMAIGVILGDRRIKGSCGGLASFRTPDGQPMCECGARSGEACGADDGQRFSPAEGVDRRQPEPTAAA